MSEFLRLYAWTIPAGALMAGALSLLGCHLAARGRGMQTLCVAQGAVFGVLVAMGLSPAGSDHVDPDSHGWPLLAALLASALTFLATDGLARRRNLARSALFASVFSVLLAAGYFTSAIFPALESHMSQIYFGDLATLTESDARLTLALAALSVAALLGFWRAISNQTFQLATFGESLGSGAGTGRLAGLAFNSLALLATAFSVQFLGFLFTVGALFLPTTLLSCLPLIGARRHYLLCLALATLSTAGGFVFSLGFSRFPTVPSVILTMAFLGLGTTGFSFLARSLFRAR